MQRLKRVYFYIFILFRNDLANIVRRRGYKVIREFLANSRGTDLDEEENKDEKKGAISDRNIRVYLFESRFSCSKCWKPLLIIAFFYFRRSGCGREQCGRRVSIVY